MAFLLASLLIICATTATVLPPPTIHATCPVVTLDGGTFIGTTTGDVNKFLGIPFAKPPLAFTDRVGKLRFHLPQAPDPYVGTHNATAYGLSCPQQATTLALPNGLPQQTLDLLSGLLGTGATILEVPDGEDCLTLNVIAPSNAEPGSELPVVVWIYGGAFETGSSLLYDGSIIVNRSIALQQPVVYVSFNYRLSAFGFLASQEVKDAKVGNLGLWDQRLALRWIQKYIHVFGGDPSKVTVWGQSAGSISMSLQMLANGGDNEGLFRAAFLQSGWPRATGDITHGQRYYDFLVERTGCTSSHDTLACLRTAPYESLKAAMNSTPSAFSYQSLALAWKPLVDGVFLVGDPQKLVQQGKVARIPFVAGECDDEGTLFSLSQTNVTTEAELRDYLSEFFLPNVTDAKMDRLLRLYPQDVTQGSPYDTGTQNAFTPEFKHIASLLGDLEFQAPRRFLLNNVSGKQHTWSYLSKRLKSLPILGSLHGSDLLLPGVDLTDYLIHFATNLDPNDRGLNPQWPRYTISSPQLLTLLDGPVINRTITLDTYRIGGDKFPYETLTSRFHRCSGLWSRGVTFGT
ncbi:carotenoid ester lipase precursor [Lactarius vividus]|nr:carotenoid ester lipase precursor [Lactarius vividus]